MMLRIVAFILGVLCAGVAQAQVLTPGTLAAAAPALSPLNSTDTFFWCQTPQSTPASPSATGCDATHGLVRATVPQITALIQSQTSGMWAPPLSYSNGTVSLLYDTTLTVVGGRLSVIGGSGGPGLTVPNSPLLGGNGSTLTPVGVGTGLSISGGNLTAASSLSGMVAGQIPVAANSSSVTGSIPIPSASLLGGTGTGFSAVGVGSGLALSGGVLSATSSLSPGNPTACVSETVQNGTATTYKRSDAASALCTTTVTAGTYTNPTSITVLASGRVSALASGTPPVSGMVAGQVPLAATATTVTSSLALSSTGGQSIGTVSGTLTAGHCAQFANVTGGIAVVDAGGACTVGGGGGTVSAGTLNQLAYYAGAGTVVSGLNLGTGLSISAGTLNVVAGTGTVNSGTGPALAQYMSGTGQAVGPISVSAVFSNPQGGPLDIAAGGITNAKLASGAANTLRGSLNGVNEVDIPAVSCPDTNGQHWNWTAGSGLSCGNSTSGVSGTPSTTGFFPQYADTTGKVLGAGIGAVTAAAANSLVKTGAGGTIDPGFLSSTTGALKSSGPGGTITQASSADLSNSSVIALLNVSKTDTGSTNSYLGYQGAPTCALTDAATITPTRSGCNASSQGVTTFTVSVGASRTINVPSDLPSGVSVDFAYWVTHTGANDGLKFGPGIQWVNGAAPPYCSVSVTTGCISITAVEDDIYCRSTGNTSGVLAKCSLPQTAMAVPASRLWVSGNGNFSSASTSTLAITLSGVNGNIVVCGALGGTQSVSGVADSLSGAFTSLNTGTNGAHPVSFWYRILTGTISSVTLTYAANDTSKQAVCDVFSGASTATGGINSQNLAAGTNNVLGAALTAANGDIVYGLTIGAGGAGTVTIGTGYTATTSNTASFAFVGEYKYSPGASETPTFSNSAGGTTNYNTETVILH